jgi:Fic/DOC family
VTDRVSSLQFRPIGTRLTVPSSLTGAPLTYFCPHPLRTLVADTLVTNGADTTVPPVDVGLGMLLVRYLLRRGLLPTAAGSPHARFESFLRPQVLRSEADFMSLASAMLGRPQRFREAISFSGGASPSSASHIYPPHQEIARLFAELPAFFDEDWRGYAATDVTAMLFYYALSTHPFANGNGRWARQVAIAAAAKAGDVWSAAVLLTLFSNRESRLIDTWRQAQDQGLSRYLCMCRTARRRLVVYAEGPGAVSLLVSAYVRLEARCGQRDAEKVFGAVLVDGIVDAERVAALLACSKKKAHGVLDALFENSNTTGLSGPVHSALWDTVDAALSGLETLELE